MIALGVFVVVFVVMMMGRRRHKKGRIMESSTALQDALGLVAPYKGPKWRSRTEEDRWL